MKCDRTNQSAIVKGRPAFKTLKVETRQGEITVSTHIKTPCQRLKRQIYDILKKYRASISWHLEYFLSVIFLTH